MRHAYTQRQLAIVTGACSGLGDGTSLALARHGVEVVLVSRERQKVDDAVARTHKLRIDFGALQCEKTCCTWKAKAGDADVRSRTANAQ